MFKLASKLRAKSACPDDNTAKDRKTVNEERLSGKEKDTSSATTIHDKNVSSPAYSGLSTESSTDSGIVSSPEASICSPSIEENALVDDQDGLSSAFAGRLTFTESPSLSPLESKDFPYEIPCDSTPPMMTYITFEVISAEVIKEGRSGHVTYTILINPNKESAKISPTVIKRRYSDFENLHYTLKKKFSSVMSQISFPRKLLVGNFTCETIAKRSTAFEQYLTHLYSVFEVRYSPAFMKFFIHDDLDIAVNYFLEEKYSNSVPYLEKTVPVLEKLYGNFYNLVCQCLCCLVVCYIKLDKVAIAHSCAEVAMKCCLPQASSADDELRCAILSTAIRLYWRLGLEKKTLESQLEELLVQSKNINTSKDLNEVLVKAFQMSVPS